MRSGTRKAPRSARLVTSGRVSCPYRDNADIDVELCFGCEKALGMRLEGPTPWVRCRTPEAFMVEATFPVR